MAIRKTGVESAKVETRVEDNDPETLNAIRKDSGREPVREGRGELYDRDSDDGQTYSL